MSVARADRLPGWNVYRAIGDGRRVGWWLPS